MKIKIEKFWVALLLPLLTFFIFPSVSLSQETNGGNIMTTVFVNTVRAETATSTTSSNIMAKVNILPAITGFCFPQNFVVNEAFGRVTCFIEGNNFNINSLSISSLRLGIQESSLSGIAIIPGSVNYIDDFNNNGAQDLFVQFDFSQFKNIVFSLALPENYHYQISGTENGIGFSQTSPLYAKLNVPQPKASTKLIDYYTSFNGNGGSIVTANGFRLSQYTAQTNRLDGYVVQRVNYPNENVQSWGNLIYASQGYVTVDFLTFPYLPPFFSMNVRESFNVVDDGFHSCSSTTNSMTICQSSGWMIKQGSGFWADNGQIPVNTLIYIITPTYAKIFGFDASNKMILEIENIKISSLSTSATIPV